MKKLILFPLLASFISLNLYSQKTDYQSRISQLYKAMNKNLYQPSAGLFVETTDPAKNEKVHSYLWPLCALIQAANEMEALEPSRSYMKPVMAAIGQYYNANPPVPAYQDCVTKEDKGTKYYDDNQWIAIASLDAYNRTKNELYLKVAKNIYRFMMTGYDTISGGGIYWREGDKTTKNTCSNGPGVLITLQLYKITKQKSYLDTALLIYNWTNKHLLSPDGIYYDHIRLPEGKIDKRAYTYNLGTMLQSTAILYTITHDKKYLSEANRLAKAGKEYFFKDGRLPGNYWFNAVMLRGYIELYKIEKDKSLLNFFMEDSERIWNTERDEKGLVGKEAAKSLIDQAAMLEIFARLQEISLK